MNKTNFQSCKRVLLLLLIGLFTSISVFAQTQNTAYRNNVIVFDITGSMVGLPQGSGNKDIWQKSLDLLQKQLQSFPKGETASIYLFGVSLTRLGVFSTDYNDTSIDQIINKIDEIRLNHKTENYTCIYKALKQVINALPQNQINTIYLFTDGKNSDHYSGCGNTSVSDFLDLWKSIAKTNEYLYVFKLKNFNIPNMQGRGIEIIDDALVNKQVIIEPINRNVRTSRKINNSKQRFRITGTGKQDLPSNIRIKYEDITLYSSTNNKSEIANISEELQLITTHQNITITTMNDIGVITPDIYQGKLSLVFSNNRKEYTHKKTNFNIKMKIIDNNNNITFDAREVQPKVVIDFIN